MIDAEIKSRLGERSVLMLTIYGEARGSTIEARIAVGCVVRNRLREYLKYRATEPTYWAVCFAPEQFSCWNGGDVNYSVLMHKAEQIIGGYPLNDPALTECGWIADGIIEKVIQDTTKDATFYLESQLYRTKPPTWATHMLNMGSIGPFVILKEPAV